MKRTVHTGLKEVSSQQELGMVVHRNDLFVSFTINDVCRQLKFRSAVTFSFFAFLSRPKLTMTKLLAGCALVFTLLLTSTQAWVPLIGRSIFQKQLSSTSVEAANNNNIVLEPSEDPAAFDSLKIGNARVHRYSREEDPDSETEYVMWYHGRPKDMEGAEKLPPLSTGRIGRATSRNGLLWKKDLKGSESEDAPDVSLGLNKESWWGFDTAHVGLGNVLLPMSTPAVLTEGGVYLMYYFGGNLEETPVGNYLDKEIPESMKDAMIQGMRMKIGVAVSQDGTSWGRVEGDDPSGACMAPYDSKDPNQRIDPTIPENMEEELYCAWPEVAVNLSSGDGSEESFRMYYSTMTKKDKQKCIAYAVSPDGFRWIKKGICLRPDEFGLDASGTARCCVLKDAIFDAQKNSWNELNSWKMYYDGASAEDGKHRILVADSDDGKIWKKAGLAFDIGAEEGAWDFGGVSAPHVVR